MGPTDPPAALSNETDDPGRSAIGYHNDSKAKSGQRPCKEPTTSKEADLLTKAWIRRKLKTGLLRLPGGAIFVDLLNLYRLREQFSSTGWLASRVSGESRDGWGKPIPWFTYPAVAFLEPRLQKSFRVYEYGSGNSTKWFAYRVASVVSCEHDPVWYEANKASMPSNVEYLCRPLGGVHPYAADIERYDQDFDLVVIDGRNRVACTRHALRALSEDGVLLFDNADREKYQSAYDLLRVEGFKRLDFHGVGPIAAREWCTAIFYRSRNVLGI